MNAQALNAPALPLQDRIVLVTGATGGIGDAIVERLAAEGARPIIHFARNEGAAKALLNRIDGRGWIVQADLTTREGPEKLWSAALQHAGHVDALINNAGIRSEIPVTADTETWQAAWEREFRINFFATADLCRLAIRHFRDRSGGSIVNMASRAGQRGYAADAMPYGASKAALINLTKSIARSFGASGITAVAIAPGWVRTAMAEDFIATHGEAAAVSDIPIGVMALPAEVAELIAFILRPGQRSLNGATLDVNGGSYIR